MKIGLIDVDSHNYPNLVLMKLSAWHKSKGDSVEWYEPLVGGWYDKVYMSKVFSFSDDYEYPVNASEIIKGGTGYAIELAEGKEIFHKEKDHDLPDEIEHIFPDYSIYGVEDTAYGFLTRGCPRGCDFCIVKCKEGTISHKVADLEEFWNGQKKIVLFDPNILACKDRTDLLRQLQESGAQVDFNQGLDIRFMNEDTADQIARIKFKHLHFAWDRYEDKDLIQPKLLEFKKRTNLNYWKQIVYVLVGDREKRVLPEDLERIYWLRDNGYDPFVMVYDKSNLPKRHELRRLQRWVNNKIIFHSCNKFEEYRS